METEVISRGGAETRRARAPQVNVGAQSAPEKEIASEGCFSSAPPRLRVNPSADAERVVSTARAWVGTPYVHQASVKGVGCDCLGLLRGVWRELRGPEPQAVPNYSPDWAEATGEETLYLALARHLHPVPLHEIALGDVALFRVHPRGPAKHCGIVADRKGMRTLIHTRQNKRVNEEQFSPLWRKRLAYAFRL